MQEQTTTPNGLAIMVAMLKGYGPEFKFKTADELMAASVAKPDDIVRLREPFPSRGRYRTSTVFLEDVTSTYALGRKRFRLFAKRLISLAKLMESYNGKHSDKKILPGLTPADEAKLLTLGDTINDDILAEILEAVTDHDTAAYADAFKILIYAHIPHLGPYVEAVHFLDTSEDNWGNVVGLTLSELVFGHTVSAYIRFCTKLLDYADKHKDTGIWNLAEAKDGNANILLVPAFTHWQSSTNSTLVKKVLTPVKQIVELLFELTDGHVFKAFGGKFGGITGNFDSHFAAYPDIDWFAHGRDYIESLGLHYEPMVHQCVSYTREAQHFRTLRTINGQVMKFANDFRFLVSCPGQLFVKKLVAGRKGSSSNPGKTNMWMTEGGIKLLKKSNMLLEFLSTELPDFAQEGDMGRSVLIRDVGSDFSPLFIALDRITKELGGCVPNANNIRACIELYPSLNMSAMQYVLKRESYEGDSYRAMQGLLINPDGSYATRAAFMPRFEAFLREAGFSPAIQSELRSHLDPVESVRPIHEQALREMSDVRQKLQVLREIQARTPSLEGYSKAHAVKN